MLIYIVTYVLLSLQRLVLKCAFYDYLNWIVGRHSHPENLSIDLISHVTKDQGYELYQFQLNNFKSTPWSSSQFMKQNEDNYSKLMPIDKFLKNLLRGDMMAFSNVE